MQIQVNQMNYIVINQYIKNKIRKKIGDIEKINGLLRI